MKTSWTGAEAKAKDLKKLEKSGIRRTNKHYYVHFTNPLPYGLLTPTTSKEFATTLGKANIYTTYCRKEGRRNPR